MTRDNSDSIVNCFNIIRTDVDPPVIIKKGLDEGLTSAWINSIDADLDWILEKTNGPQIIAKARKKRNSTEQAKVAIMGDISEDMMTEEFLSGIGYRDHLQWPR